MRSILCVMKKVVDIDPAPRSPFHNFSGDSMSTGGGPLWVGSAQHEGTKTRLRHDLDGRVGDLANERIAKRNREHHALDSSCEAALSDARSFPKGGK